ncbi:hypothetical protein ACFPIJ_35050 [Dactylosporangium cerinum]|uniref:Uncharacterized protein n=1 Tax=Dactylosporangium cerinum TaxID=1434730 RepID=A0ABV9W5N3_9ACTN
MRELAPHLVWEVVLLLAAGAVVAGLYNANSAVFTRGQVWAGIAILGFAACGLALSLRTATPNLAIGSIAVLAGWVFADLVNDGTSVAVAFIVAVLAAAGVGVLLALLAGLTALPAWGVTLGGGFIVSAALLEATEGRLVPVTGDARSTTFGLWAAAFVVVSVVGGVLFALPAVRRFLSANRPVAGDDDPARWRPAKLVGALVGITGSAVLAGVSGVLSVRLTSAAAFSDSGQLPYALAAVLLGGVSLFGRRAGVFGVVLGVVIVDGVRRWEVLEGANAATALLTTGVLAVVGLIAVWLLELIGRRLAPLAAAAPPVFAPPTPGFPPGSPAGIPSQSAGGYPPPPLPTSGGPAFGQPTYPAQPGPVIPQPWTVPGTGGTAPQVPSQPFSPPVSGPPNTDPPPGYPQTPPPSWPPAPNI